MKIIIAVDQLLERDISTSMVETLLSLGHEVELVTLAHRVGEITGPIFSHKITGSYLSLFFKRKKTLFKFPSLCESAAKFFKIPNADFYIFLSRGFIHQVKTPSEKFRINYFFEKQGRDRCLKEVTGSKIFCSEVLRKNYDLGKEKYEIVPPPFMSRDFPVMGRYYENKTVLIRVKGFNPQVISSFLEKNKNEYHVKILCDSSSYARKYKKTFLGFDVLENISNGAFYIELLQAFLFVDLTTEAFPEKAFCSLCTGVPCFVVDNEVNREFLTEDVVSFFKNDTDLFAELDKFLNAKKVFKPEILRRFALRFNERIFKNKFLRQVREFEKVSN